MINSFVWPKWGIAYIVLPFFDTEIVNFVGVGERRSDSCTEFDDCFAFCFFLKKKSQILFRRIYLSAICLLIYFSGQANFFVTRKSKSTIEQQKFKSHKKRNQF